MNVGIIGATGYTGSELVRWLLDHPTLRLTAVASVRNPGRRLDEVVPALAGCTDLRCSEVTPGAFAACDVVCLAVPHGEAAPIAEALSDRVIVDLSADHRHVPGWTYGLAEWNAEAIAGAARIAVPGCFATAMNLSILPFVGRIAGPVAVAAATGSTGSGAAPGAATHHPERFANLKAYKVLTHQHVPEVRATLAAHGQDVELLFVPTSAPLDRGIFATSFVPLADGGDPATRVAEAYAHAPLVRVRSSSPEVRHVRGTAFVDLSVYRQGTTAVVLAALDNLGKGAATQAVQCLNLVAGLPAHTGLRRPAALP